MLNLAVTTSSLSITLALAAITSKGRELAGKAWKWVTGLFGKTPSRPREVSFVVERENAKGDKFKLGFSYREVLKNLPPATGGSLPAKANPQPAQPLLPPQGVSSQSANASQSLPKNVKRNGLAKRRRSAARRVIERLQPSRKVRRTR